MRIVYFILLLVAPYMSFCQKVEIGIYLNPPVTFDFGNGKITNIISEIDNIEDSADILETIQLIESSYNSINVNSLLAQISGVRQAYKFDDWYTIKLIENLSSGVFYKTYNPALHYRKSTLLCWLLLNKIGFDVRLVYKNNLLIQFGKCDTPTLYQVELNDNRFFRYHIFMHALKADAFYSVSVSNGDFRHAHQLNPTGKIIDLNINNYPFYGKSGLFQQEINVSINKKDTFQMEIEAYAILQLDNSPSYQNYVETLNVGLSDYNNAKLDSVMASYKVVSYELLEGIFNYVNNSLALRPDNSEFGFRYHKRLTAEQALHEVDCDLGDFTTVLYNFIKRIEGLEIIILSENEELDEYIIGVHFQNNEFAGFKYEGKTYLLFDFRTDKLGDTLLNLEGNNIKVITLK